MIRRGGRADLACAGGQAFPIGRAADHPHGQLQGGTVLDAFADPRVDPVIHRVENLSRAWSNLGTDEAAGRQAWLDVMTALEADADAKLPG